MLIGLFEISLADNPIEEFKENCFPTKSLYTIMKKRPDSFFMKEKGKKVLTLPIKVTSNGWITDVFSVCIILITTTQSPIKT